MSERASLTVGLGSNAPRGLPRLFCLSLRQPCPKKLRHVDVSMNGRLPAFRVPAGVRTEQQVMTLHQRLMLCQAGGQNSPELSCHSHGPLARALAALGAPRRGFARRATYVLLLFNSHQPIQTYQSEWHRKRGR